MNRAVVCVTSGRDISTRRRVTTVRHRRRASSFVGGRSSSSRRRASQCRSSTTSCPLLPARRARSTTRPTPSRRPIHHLPTATDFIRHSTQFTVTSLQRGSSVNLPTLRGPRPSHTKEKRRGVVRNFCLGSKICCAFSLATTQA